MVDSKIFEETGVLVSIKKELHSQYNLLHTEKLIIEKKYHSPFSQVYLVSSTKLPFPLAVKIITADGVTSTEQYDGLTEASRRLGTNSKFRSPRPVQHFHKLNALTMEWIPGKTLSELVLSAVTTKSEILGAVIGTGQWLRRATASDEAETQQLDSERLDLELNELVAKTYQEGTYPKFIIDGLSCLRENKSTVAKISTPGGFLHGDFKAENILLSDELIYGLEYSGKFLSSTIYDISYFLVNFELLKFKRLGLGFYLQIDEIKNAFLSGYFDEAPVPLLPTRWMSLHTAMRLYIDAIHERRPMIRSLLIKGCFHQLIRKLTAELKSVG